MGQDSAPRIVVGVDGSEQSIDALRYAKKLASVFESPIHAISAWEYPAQYAGYVPLGSDNFAETTRERLDEALSAAYGSNLPSDVGSTVVFAHPAKALIEASRGAALLVVGRRGHGTFRGLLLGSVSGACVAHAHCPVLVIPKRARSKDSASDEHP